MGRTLNRLAQLIALGLAVGLLAGAAGAADQEGHGDAKKDHPPAKYKVAFHDADGKHQHADFDLSNREHEHKLAELLTQGHVLELENNSPPDISKLFSLKADLGIWSLVIFGLLFFVLNKFAWPKMLAGLQKREANIRGALDEATKARDDAQGLRAQFQKQIDQAHLEVKALIDEAKRDAAAVREEEVVKTKAEIQAERDRLHREIEVETDQALQKIWSRAAELATQISAQALRKQIDVETHRRLIDEALGELRTNGN